MTAKTKLRMYYMHPINTYGTELERLQLSDLHLRFGSSWEIVNPNAPEHQRAEEERKQKTGDGMPYFVSLAEACEGGVFLPFRDWKIPAGIAKEVRSLLGRNCRVWELRHDGRLIHVRELDERRVLSVVETRARIRNEDGTRKPY